MQVHLYFQCQCKTRYAVFQYMRGIILYKRYKNLTYGQWKQQNLCAHDQGELFYEMSYILRRSVGTFHFESEGTKLLNAPRMIENVFMIFEFQMM